MASSPHNGNGQRVLSYWQTAFLVVVPLASAGVAYLNLQITAAVEQPKREAAQLVIEVERLSRKLEEESKTISILQSQLTASDSERKAHDAELETQIDSMAQSLAIQFANSQRTMEGVEAALHELGAKYPLPPAGPWYFPNISNRNPNGKR